MGRRGWLGRQSLSGRCGGDGSTRLRAADGSRSAGERLSGFVPADAIRAAASLTGRSLSTACRLAG